MNSRSALKFILLINITAISLITALDADFDKIFNTVFQKQDELSRQIKDAVFQGDFRYIETDSKGDTTKTIYAKRRIFYYQNEIKKSEYLTMQVDGKVLSSEEIKKQTAQNNRDQQTKLPFDKKYRHLYKFNYIKDTILNDHEVWQIEFKPIKKSKDEIEGFAYVSKNDTNVLRYQFKPIGLPFVVKDFNINLDFAKQQNFYLPEKFSLKMNIDVKLIFNFYNKYIEMQELYSDYQLNIAPTDSLIDKD